MSQATGCGHKHPYRGLEHYLANEPVAKLAGCGMSFSCQHCGQHVATEHGVAGMTTACPTCGKEIDAPSSPIPELVDTGIRRASSASRRWASGILFRCPKCAERLEIDGSKGGTSVRCPVCSLMFLAPKPACPKDGLAPWWVRWKTAFAAAGAVVLVLAALLAIRGLQHTGGATLSRSSANDAPAQSSEQTAPRLKRPAGGDGNQHASSASFTTGEKTILLRFIACSIGLGYLIYGRKQARIATFIAGLALCLLPLLIASHVIAALVCVLLIAVPFVVRE